MSQALKKAAPKPGKNVILSDGDEAWLVGSAADDKFVGGAGKTMAGLTGNDIYVVTSKDDRVVEKAGGGDDTVQVSQQRYYELAENVENVVFYGMSQGRGNDLDNDIRGSVYDQVLEGAGGNDTIKGGGGADTFLFRPGSGADVITDFSAADLVRLDGYGLMTFAEVKGAMRQDGEDVVLRLSDTDLVRFENTRIADFRGEQFQLPIDVSKLQITFAEEFDGLSLYNAETHQGIWTASTKSSQQTTSHSYINPNDPSMKAGGINPFSVANGVMTITATPTTDATRGLADGKDYTSGKLTTEDTFYQKYGYFEMRATLPQGQGAWPAFWLWPAGERGQNKRELDIMEQVADGYSHVAAHYARDGKGTTSSYNEYMGEIAGYHTYGMLWTEKEIAWYIDGVEVYSIPTPPDLNQPMHIIVNLAMGGSWAGDPNLAQGAQQMHVDYVRAYSVDPQATSADVNAGGLASKGPAATPPPPAGDANGPGSGGQVGGSSSHDALYGGSGADGFFGGLGNDLLDGRGGSDTASYYNAPKAVYVNLSLQVAQDTGGGGVDTLISIENLTGSEWNDGFIGNEAANTLDGVRGDDKLAGGAGDDTLIGGVGDDVLEGGIGNDILDGASGTDVASYAGAASGVRVSLADIKAQDTLGAGTDTLVDMESLIGSAHNDLLTGNRLSNVIEGGDGADVIDGADGADVITGGLGGDTIAGGGGSDRFIFNSVAESRAGNSDWLVDYRGNDIIDLSAIDADESLAGNQAFSFIGSSGFTRTAGELRIEKGLGGFSIYGDVNGDGQADLHIEIVSNIKTIVWGDFIL